MTLIAARTSASSALSFAFLIASNQAFFGIPAQSREVNSRLILGAIFHPIIAASMASVTEPVKT
ncbi:hypothetical protein [Exiguobacterium sp. s95]|uniref:hypothetical protein n=1 Tax=Exiguobacterium sp. s95 TaxID=2751211 RepID=UPI002036A43E|nr:hypothetical protein [Exiguobacterium sp. s95]